MSMAQERVEIAAADSALNSGVGPLFLDDPTGKTVAFAERGQGVFIAYEDGFSG